MVWKSEIKENPTKIINNIKKSLCKIIFQKKEDKIIITGFFVKVSESLKYLITNYNKTIQNLLKNNIEIEIWNNQLIKLNLKNHKIKYIEQPNNLLIIEIKNSDEINKDILFLDFDINCINIGYYVYEYQDIYSIEYPYENKTSITTGQIVSVYDYEFAHNIPIKEDLSGCPILYINNDKNLLFVIGIHKKADLSKKINSATFIGEIIKEINDDINIKTSMEEINKNNNNYIFGEIIIKEEDVNKNIRIINSYEEMLRDKGIQLNLNDKDNMNEEEIKKCEIKINDEAIPLNYFWKFKYKGKYVIKYFFKEKLSKTNYMFFECDFLTNLDLSNFNTQNVTNMSNMFNGCSSLTKINLSNMNTEKVTNMSNMFQGCTSLTNINLSSFNTQNVKNMASIFAECSSLTSIDLSNFNIKNISEISNIFKGCLNLKKENVITNDENLLNKL